MSRLASLVLLTVAWLGAPALARGEKVVYDHEGRPLFSVTFPDRWFLDTDFADEARAAGADLGAGPGIRIVEAMPDDGTKLWLGAWVVPRASTLDRGLEYVASLDGELFSDIAATGYGARSSFGSRPRGASRWHGDPRATRARHSCRRRDHGRRGASW